MSAVEQKKELVRAAVQQLNRPASLVNAHEAMETLCQAVCFDFDDHDGSIGVFIGDDDFKEEIFSAQVIHVLITAAKVSEEHHPNFYHKACGILSLLCCDNTDLADAFMALGGVEFLLESLEAFSSDQIHLTACVAVHASVMGSASGCDSTVCAGKKILEKLVDVFELNYETANEMLYYQYCLGVGNSLFCLGVRLDGNVNVIRRILSHVWHGVIKHKYDEDAQGVGRRLLCHLVGKEAGKEMINHAEMRHCEEEECAGCA